MKIAFYAPMKSPDHPIPSGDQIVGRALITALESAGHDVDICCRIRTWQKFPDARRQERLARLSKRAAELLIRRYERRPGQRPDLWFTYHLYHKAPDWLGPAVSERLGIPYVVAEASFAPKRAEGPWDVGHKAAEAAIRRAKVIFGMNSLDAECVAPLVSDGAGMIRLKPFLAGEAGPGRAGRGQARWALSARYGLDPDIPWLLTVAMMRDDAKLRSYETLAAALDQVSGASWQLIVAGDGEVRSEVEKLFPFDRAVFTGQLGADGLAVLYSAADLYVWPAINEAYGMALLEAQAAGLPAVAGDTGGVGDIVRHGETGLLVPVGDAAAFAEAVMSMLGDEDSLGDMGRQAAEVAEREHSLEAASAAMGPVLEALVQ